MAPLNANRAKKPYNRPAPRPRGTDGEWLHDRAPGATVVDTGSSNTARTPATINTRLIVSNLHYEVTPKDLTQIFGQIGTLVREPLIRVRSSECTDTTAAAAPPALLSSRSRHLLRQRGRRSSMMGSSPKVTSAHVDCLRHLTSSRPAGARRGASSLLNRIQKPPLLERLSRNDPQPQSTTPSRSGPGPVRTKARGAGAGRALKKPATAEQLDSELDAFMKDDVASAQRPAAGKVVEEDVEMS
ncbi:hypothetical protein A0H81_12462 [Grifola frondosa]|uniref:Chromatin target of PRMT1 protein C-terminal domain-containing protein n=1 Tax=Grifola frondosa TaxID=5627 RepID=A0A1C7LTG7_GRIFR|nr:hypothetical protein A0H81_12462 [Grifola frondosa]